MHAAAGDVAGAVVLAAPVEVGGRQPEVLGGLLVLPRRLRQALLARGHYFVP